MELQDAMVQISAIRRQLARNERFRGYRSAPVAVSGLLAFAAGGVQAVWLPKSTEQLPGYLVLWTTVAAASLLLCLGDVWLHHRHSAGLLHKDTLQLALEQFAPCVVAGGLVTWALARSAPEAAWMFPGLWSVMYSLGLFASWRLLPRAIFGVAAYYLAGGIVALSLGGERYALSAWAMPLLFGVGQLLNAVVLFRSDRD